jgi:hypothetical protein
MQTSKIIIGDHYAVKYRGNVVRLKVTEIVSVTVRTHKKSSPSNTVNTIKGMIEAGDLPPGTPADERLHSTSPEDVISHYTEFAELRAKYDEEERIRKETQAHEEGVRDQLRAKLYEITGIAKPTGHSYSEPFNAEYTNSIRITGHETIELLLALLESVEWATTSATAR